MINPIYFLSALSWEMVVEQVAKLDKCNITGKIKDIKIINNSVCLDNVEIIISGSNGYYKVNVSKTTDADCSHDSIYLLYGNKNLPKVGDKVNYLIDKSSYHIISDNKVGNGVYKLRTGTNSEGNTKICESNSSFVEANNDYLYYGILICILLIIAIIFSMYRNKNK